MKKGILCISIDTELLWGRKDGNWKDFTSQARKTQNIIKKLLRLFEKYNIPVTWAIVGKLYEKGDPLWHFPNLINLIEEKKIHEIASHSYSHKIFTDIDKKEAEIEIKKNKALSFVFPQNKIKYLKVLKKYGFRAYRGKDRNEKELLLFRRPPVYPPLSSRGITNIPGSMYLVSGRGNRKYIPSGLRSFKCKLGINRAIKEGKVFHLWFHPIDLADDTAKLFPELECITKYANQKREEGKLEIKTMREIATGV